MVREAERGYKKLRDESEGGGDECIGKRNGEIKEDEPGILRELGVGDKKPKISDEE